MNQPPPALPNDVHSLKELAVEQGGTIRRLEQMLRLKDEMIRLMRIEKYGPKSEKLSDNQLSLLDEEPSVRTEEVEQETTRSQPIVKKKRGNPRPGRVELPAHLPRVEEIICCSSEQCHCGQCGIEKKVIGYESSEVLEVKPAEYFVRVIKREKRVCPSCPEEGVVCAAPPVRIVEKGKLSDAFIVEVMIKKYRDHNPLFRQEASLLSDAGLEIDRSTLCFNVMKAGELCMALAREMKKDLLEGRYIQADESPVGVQDGRTQGRNHQAYMWQYSRPHGPVVFDFRMGRGREGPVRFLKQFEGILQSDGYGAYKDINDKGIIYAGCLTHARRYFDKARKVAPEDPIPRKILEKIAQIYEVEKQARENALSVEERLELRKERSAQLVEELKQLIIEARQKVLPASLVGKACNYALGQWDRLIEFLKHGVLEADNNWCENAIRPLALGRKNWLHIGSEEAGSKIAGIMSIMETCRRLKINVREYLLDVLPGLADKPQSELAQLTPMAWKARQAQS